MRLNISHTTQYSYSGPVGYGLQELRLTPKSRPAQKVQSWETSVTGGKIELTFEDQHSNTVHLVSFTGEENGLTVTCAGVVETTDTVGVLGKHGGFTPLWYFQRSTALTRAGQQVRALSKGLNSEVEDPIQRLHALSTRILEALPYEIGKTGLETTAEDAVGIGAGVCQDHSHVFLACARSLGFPARYVSGYLMLDGQTQQDATHAWAEAHVAGIGWVGFDVSNGISPDERYVRVATGLDYSEAAPIRGLHLDQGTAESLNVDIQVQQ